MHVLRIAKRRMALAVGLADIAGLWALERVSGALSAFADVALERATAHLLAEAVRAGELPAAARDGAGSGLIVLGMGKLGAHELNYSSDVDLIVLYDTKSILTDDPGGLQHCFVRLTRKLVRIMGERTEDGYVFRTDLRLRPDAGATLPALSTAAAETYYESMGQNWERAAFIKARPVAADLAAGQAFLAHLRPYVWRRHLDFAAIQDIHSIKRQINAHRGSHAVAVAGHNIKLGRGGIREIELFAQTQQLIWGGREPGLRAAGTCDALRALGAAGRLGTDAVEDLVKAYRALRRLEHRLQMIDDEQTHSVPREPEALAALACFLGYRELGAFEEELTRHLSRVEERYGELFEAAPALGGPGNLVFTGAEHDPDTLETLAGLGFADPEAVSSLVRAWHHGRYRATRSTRARELLTEIMPTLLVALAKTTNPAAAFTRFDEFLVHLPAGVQIFSLFHANPGLLDLVADIMGNAPRLADHLARRPGALETVLMPEFAGPPPDKATLRATLAAALAQARDFEDVLDIVRRWAADRRFQVGVEMLGNRIRHDAAAAALSDVADCALAALQPHVEADFARRHGRIEGAAVVILALGKLGGREMTVSADLDLVFLYDVPAGIEASDGPRPLAPSHYFARLSQSMLNAVTALTGEGRLYDVDMRLRPSGGAGPIATALESYVRYHREAAWTWEHLALTRARVIDGDPALTARVRAAVREVLCAPRPAGPLLEQVAEMRERIAREHPVRSRWEAKHLRGGLIDIEFIAQYFQLRHAHAHPEVLSTNTADALGRLAAAGQLAPAVADELIAAARLWGGVQAMLRLTVGEAFEEETAPEGLRALLAKGAGAVDFKALKATMRTVARRVRRRYAALIDEPAKAAGGDEQEEGKA